MNKGLTVLSLFDGMSCGQQALNRANIKYKTYYASEIDKPAISVTQHNYPNTIQLGSVVDLDGNKLPKIDLLIGGSPCQSFSFAGKRKGMSTKCEIEILTIEQYLKLKAEGYEFEGQSYLFWEFMRLLKEVKPKYFLLENVIMSEKWEKVLSKAIGVNPIEINSSLVSAQNRRRLYWTNIGLKPMGLFNDLESIIKQPKDKGIVLKDILELNVPEKYTLSEKMIASMYKHTQKMKERGNGFEFSPTTGEKKGKSLMTKSGSRPDDNFIIVHNTMPRSSTNGNGGTGHLSRTDGKTYCLDTGQTNVIQINPSKESGGRQPYQQNRVYDIIGQSPALMDQLSVKSYAIKDSTIIRRLTPKECERLQTVSDGYTSIASDTQRYKMLGNGWTIDVIAHIFKHINL